MRDALIIAWREFSVRVFRWAFWLVGLGVPAIGLVFLVGLALGTTGDQRTIAVVDAEGALGDALLLYFEEDPLFVIEVGEPDPARLERDVAGVLQLDAQTRSDGTARFRGRRALPTAHSQALEQGVQYVLIEEALAKAGMSTDVLQGVALDFETLAGEADESDAELRVGAAIAGAGIMILWLTLAGHPLQVVLSVLEEKESGLVEALLGITSARSLLIGKIIGLGGVAVVQGALWFSPFLILSLIAGSISEPDPEAKALFAGLPGADDVLVFGLALVLGYLSFTLIAAILASLLPSKQHADSANMALMILGFVPVAIGLPAASNPMALSARVFGVLPPFAPIVSFARYPSGGPVGEIALGFVMSGLFVVAMLYVADRVFMATALGAWKPSLPWRR